MKAGSYCQATCGACSQAGCADKQPPGGWSCVQQKSWGACSAAWMRDGGFCQLTCGSCGGAAVASVQALLAGGEAGVEGAAAGAAECSDIPPPGNFSCPEQRAWGMCGAMEGSGLCQATCGVCTLPPPPCDDTPTPDGIPCQETLESGKCASDYIRRGAYCQRSCGACPAASDGAALVQAVDQGCSDAPTPDGVSCLEHRTGEQCQSSFLVDGGYCQRTCGRCNATASPVAAPVPEAEAEAVRSYSGLPGGRKLQAWSP